jgi:hypothetical protein
MLLPSDSIVENAVEKSVARSSSSSSWLPRALVISALLHGLGWGLGALASSGGRHARSIEIVDIELAPAPPKAEILPQEKSPVIEAATSTGSAPVAPPSRPDDGVAVLADAGADAQADAGADAQADAGIDAGIDARVRKKRKRDAGPDATPDAAVDGADARDAPDAADLGDADLVASTAVPGDAGADAATTDAATTDAATTDGATVDGLVALDPEAGLGDTPTSAGTASNLLAYLPKGHLVTALIRFDRLRGTRWAAPAERLLRPMPDYRSLFGGQDTRLVDRFDTLVISSPRPRDPTATTLAGRSSMSRPELRRFFQQQGASVAWSVVAGGALGVRRGGRQIAGDQRLILAPLPGWFFLAPAADLSGLTAPAKGDVDSAMAKARLPAWLQRVQTIESESGQPWGPALIVTVTATRARWKLPDLGLGVESIPAPERATVAMELVKQGWVVRGNVKFASEAEAEEFATSVQTVRQRVADSSLFQSLLKRGNALNAVLGLSVQRTGQRVAYATSLSIKDAQALLAVAATMLDQYFGRTSNPASPAAP